MGVEVLIYSYTIICLCMIAFNIATIFVTRQSGYRHIRRCNRLNRAIERQLERIHNGKRVEEQHQQALYRSLKRVSGLMAFDSTLEELYARDPDGTSAYLSQSMGVFTYLMTRYVKKNPMQTAYFTYLLAKYQVCRNQPFAPIKEALKQLLGQPNLYCRENALKAFYRFGDPVAVAEAIRLLDQAPVFHHSKLITDGLLSFQGDHKQLAALLWADFKHYCAPMRVSIANYIRFQTGSYQEPMLQILLDPSQDPELHFAAIRYLGRYPYGPALPVLIDLLLNSGGARWNYAAISAAALSGYPGDGTKAALKEALKNANWYVRYNASQSLMQIGVSNLELVDILNGDDRYAREMIAYRMEARYKEQTVPLASLPVQEEVVPV